MSDGPSTPTPTPRHMAGLDLDWARPPKLLAWAGLVEMPSGRAVVDEQAYADRRIAGRIPMDSVPAILKETGLQTPHAVEHLYAVYVDREMDLIATHHLAKGSRYRNVLDPFVLLRGLAACNAAGLVLVHNHPTPSPVPSREDIALTRSLAYLCFCAGAVLVDHVIVGTTGRHWSFGCGWAPVQSATTASLGGMIWVLDPRDTTPDGLTEDRRRQLEYDWETGPLRPQTREEGASIP